MREIFHMVDNGGDFHRYVSGFASKVKAPQEIRYQKHPVNLHSPPFSVFQWSANAIPDPGTYPSANDF
jgi:hypothetical protein